MSLSLIVFKAWTALSRAGKASSKSALHGIDFYLHGIGFFLRDSGFGTHHFFLLSYARQFRLDLFHEFISGDLSFRLTRVASP